MDKVGDHLFRKGWTAETGTPEETAKVVGWLRNEFLKAKAPPEDFTRIACRCFSEKSGQHDRIPHSYWRGLWSDDTFKTGIWVREEELFSSHELVEPYKYDPNVDHFVLVHREALDNALSGKRDYMGTINLQRRCQGWLAEQMRACKDKRPMPKEEYRIDAKAKFKGLGERTFDRAWKDAIQQTGANWDRPGRPVLV